MQGRGETRLKGENWSGSLEGYERGHQSGVSDFKKVGHKDTHTPIEGGDRGSIEKEGGGTHTRITRKAPTMRIQGREGVEKR